MAVGYEAYEMCSHGRHVGALCEPCGMDELSSAPSTLDRLKAKNPAKKIPKKVTQPSGLDAPYYNIPDNVNTMQDMIEWLELDFGNGNILKSLVRENNPDAKKETTALYEAEKRFYYAQRHLRRVSAMQEERATGK